MQARKEPSSSGMTWASAAIGGLMLAAADESFTGFLIGIALGVAFAQILHLRKRVRALQEQLDGARHSVTRLPAQSSTSTASPAAEPQPIVDAPPAAAADDDWIELEPRIETPAPAPVARPLATQVKREPDWTDRLIAQAIAWLKRGNPLARVGIVILFFGGAFLAKYAAEHSLFPIELRFIGIAAVAMGLLIVGWRLRTKRQVYAEVLQGGGIAGLYLTVFAAASLYQLLPLGLALALMIVIAVTAALIAVAQNALSLAVIGTAGGFLAPILVSSGSGNYVALFTYYAILNLGIFAVAWFRTWRVLNVLGFVFTFTITGLWRATGYTNDDLVTADAFLILFFLMYVAVSILNCVRQPPNLKGYVSGSLVFGLPIVAFTLHATMVARIEYAMAWSALATGTFYLALAFALLRSGRESFRLLVEAFAALGVIFGSLAIPLAFDTRVTAAMWAVEGAGLLWLGVRQHRKLPRAFGALLQTAGGCGYLLSVAQVHSDTPILNTAFLGAAMLAVAGLFSGYCLHRNREHEATYERNAHVAFAIWGTAWWLLGGIVQIERFAHEWLLGVGLIYVAVTCVALTVASATLKWPAIRWIALCVPALGAAFGTLGGLSLEHPFAQAGSIGWALLFGAFYWMLERGERASMPREASAMAHAAAAWSLLVIIAWEATWQIDMHAAGVWPMLPWGVVPALFVAAPGQRAPRPRWPLAEHASVYRTLIAAPIVVFMALWIVGTCLTSVGDPVWIPYVPLLNPLDITVALCLLSGALWWTGLNDEQRAKVWPLDGRVLIACVAGVAFLWLNSALLRALHHNFGAPITLHGMARSQFVQAALSIFWGLLGFAAMTLAARKRWRYVWLVGGALMVIVVAKLFLVDLSGASTIARIVSFLTIGALLLITGYLAPLPPKSARQESDATANSQEDAI